MGLSSVCKIHIAYVHTALQAHVQIIYCHDSQTAMLLNLFSDLLAAVRPAVTGWSLSPLSRHCKESYSINNCIVIHASNIYEINVYTAHLLSDMYRVYADGYIVHLVESGKSIVTLDMVL